MTKIHRISIQIGSPLIIISPLESCKQQRLIQQLTFLVETQTVKLPESTLSAILNKTDSALQYIENLRKDWLSSKNNLMELLNNEKAPVSNQTSRQSAAVEDVFEEDNMSMAAIEETFIECSVFQLTEIPYQIKSSNLSVNTIQ